MRFAPGQVSLDGHDCVNSMVDTGRPLSMVDETYPGAFGLTGTLEDIDLTALGQSRRSGKILRNAHVQLDPHTFAVDLVVTTTSPVCDLLLGNTCCAGRQR